MHATRQVESANLHVDVQTVTTDLQLPPFLIERPLRRPSVQVASQHFQVWIGDDVKQVVIHIAGDAVFHRRHHTVQPGLEIDFHQGVTILLQRICGLALQETCGGPPQESCQCRSADAEQPSIKQPKAKTRRAEQAWPQYSQAGTAQGSSNCNM